MAKFGNIEANTLFRFGAMDDPTSFGFEVQYKGDGTESPVEFEKNLLDAVHWIAKRFRISKENMHMKMLDAIFSAIKQDYDAAGPRNERD